MRRIFAALFLAALPVVGVALPAEAAPTCVYPQPR